MLAGLWLGSHAKACELDAALLPGLVQSLWVVGRILHEYGHCKVCKPVSDGLKP